MTNESVVFDYLPPGVLPLVTDEIEQKIADHRRYGNEIATWDVMLDAQINEFRHNTGLGDRLQNVYAEAGVDVISPTVWSPDPKVSFVEGVYRDCARWEARIDALDWMTKITSPADVSGLQNSDRVGVLLNVQNLGAFTEGDLQRVDDLHNTGVRIMQLTYNKQNAIGSGCVEDCDAGLSNHGRAVVERLNKLDTIIDLSHCGKETTLETIRRSSDPVAATHSHCGALHTHSRAKSDEELEAIAEKSGFFGAVAYPHHYDDPSFDTYFDHLEHAISVMGLEHVGITTDWGMMTPDVPESLQPGLVAFLRKETEMREDTQEYSSISADRFERGLDNFRTYDQHSVIEDELRERGYGRSERTALLGGNFFDFWRRVVDSGTV